MRVVASNRCGWRADGRWLQGRNPAPKNGHVRHTLVGWGRWREVELGSYLKKYSQGHFVKDIGCNGVSVSSSMPPDRYLFIHAWRTSGWTPLSCVLQICLYTPIDCLKGTRYPFRLDFIWIPALKAHPNIKRNALSKNRKYWDGCLDRAREKGAYERLTNRHAIPIPIPPYIHTIIRTMILSRIHFPIPCAVMWRWTEHTMITALLVLFCLWQNRLQFPS